MNILDWRSVAGFCNPGELEEFEELCKLLERDNKNLMFAEVGSYMGKSTTLLAQFGKVVAIDLGGDLLQGESKPAEIGQNNFPQLLLNLTNLKLLPHTVTPICSTSDCFALFPNESFDLIYIDADHSYAACLADLVNAYPKLKKGGIFAVHDMHWGGKSPDETYNVHEAVTDFINMIGLPYSFHYHFSLVFFKFWEE